jgi:hypothetical protein
MTIYAIILNSINPKSSAKILHFHGERRQKFKWSDLYVTDREGSHGIHPYSFLAQHGFVPITDKFFVKNYGDSNLWQKIIKIFDTKKTVVYNNDTN